MKPWKIVRAIIEFGTSIALFYVVRAVGGGAYLALVISSVIPAAVTIVKFIWRRKVDGLSLYWLAVMTLSVLASVVSGSARALLVREGWLTGVSGIWFLASAWTNKPLSYLYTRPLLERRVGLREVSWDVLWQRLPKFRRIWRICTVGWGVGLLVDAAIRVFMAYTLPVDVVPALGTALLIATSLVLLVFVNVVQFRAGMFNPRSALYASLSAPSEVASAGVAHPLA